MSKHSKQFVGGVVFFVLSLFYGWGAFSIDLFVVGSKQVFTARTLPFALSLIGLACSLGLIIPALVRMLRKSTPPAETTETKESPSHSYWKPLILFILLMIVYAFLFNLLGFIVTTVGFIFTGAFILGERRVFRTIVISFAVVMGFWLIISVLLDIHLAPGLLWESLGQLVSIGST